MIEYLYDDYLSKNKIKVMCKLFLSALACNISMALTYNLFNKILGLKLLSHKLNDSIYEIMHNIIIAPIFEEITFRSLISLIRFKETDENNKNKSYYPLITALKIFAYGYSLIIFPLLHLNNFNNFNSDETNTNISTFFALVHYGIPAIYLTYLSHTHSLARSVIFHSFVNMNVRLIVFLQRWLF